MSLVRLALAGLLLSFALAHSDPAAQRTVRISNAWVKAVDGNAVGTTAFATVENGTMYDIYIVAVETDVGAAELLQVSGGKAAVVKEVTVPAFDKLEMSAETAHIRIGGLKRPLKAGETVSLTLTTDGGQALAVDALVK
jgi:copper(I)-binding protein